MDDFCTDCKVRVRDIGEYCMLIGQTWGDCQKRGRTDMLCLGCIENRLGRLLNASDFTEHQQNYKPGKSERMLDRMARVDNRNVNRV